MAVNLDKLGLLALKPSPRLYSVELSEYQRAIDWLVERTGFVVEYATLDPYVERWSFYDESGELLFALPHAFIERIQHALQERGPAALYARRASRDSEALGGRDTGDETPGEGGWFGEWTKKKPE